MLRAVACPMGHGANCSMTHCSDARSRCSGGTDEEATRRVGAMVAVIEQDSEQGRFKS
jgi:hypothetical protein